MKYSVVLKVEGDKDLYEALLPDISKTERAEWDVKLRKGKVEIKIDAKDIKAFKAFVSSITKLLEVHEKVKGVEDGC